MKKHYCIDCKKEVSDYRVKRCRACANKQHSLEMIGQNNPSFKYGLPKCIDCRKELKNRYAKRCQKCYHEYIKNTKILKGRIKSKSWKNKIRKTLLKNGTFKGKNNPMFGKITHSKYIKYKNIYFHSSWEVAYANYLDKQGLKWLYEPKAFDLGKTTYRPDFYLPKTDEYIEIKGFWRDDAKKKFKLFKKKYKQIKIKVLDYKYLKNMEVI